MKQENNGIAPVSYTNFAFDPDEVVGKIELSNPAKADLENRKIGFLKLFRFASKSDWILISLSLTGAIVRGPSYFLLGYFFIVTMTDALISEGNKNTATEWNSTSNFNSMRCNATNITSPINYEGELNRTIMQEIVYYGIGVGIMATVNFFLDMMFTTFLNIAAKNQVFRIRNAYFMSILKQDIEWHDQKGTRDLTSQMSEDINRIQDAIGEKLGIFLYTCSVVISNICGSLFLGWRLSLIALPVVSIIAIGTTFLAKIQTNLIEKESEMYSEAGGLAEELFAAIKTVKAFNAENQEINLFRSLLKPILDSGIRRGLLTGSVGGLIWFMNFSVFSLIFWFGIKLILESCSSQEYYSAGIIANILYDMLDTSYRMGQILPLLETFTTAQRGAENLFLILDRTPTIDSTSTEGIEMNNFQGRICFRRISFSYPSRPEVSILNETSFKIEAGETVALVGQSGCGKSTCIQLLQRFYDPSQGSIELDGNDIRKFNVNWLRNQIGVVGQEPVLFSTSIAENIRFGRPNASQGDIEKAAILANAHDFIRLLPLGYETQVGRNGSELSGGQKQRIAIARSLIRNPKILLFDEATFDEATSALDSISESAVQQALNDVQKDRTTIIVAHRISTIRNVDRILVLEKGKIVEEGTYAKLMERKGIFYYLVKSQEASDGQYISNTPNSKKIRKQLTIEENIHQNNGDRSIKFTSECDNVGDGSIKRSNFFVMLRMNRFQWHWILLATIGSFLVGLSTPLYAVLYGELMGVLSQMDEESIQRQTYLFSLLFLVIAFSTGLGSFLETFLFSLTGEKLAFKLKTLSFETILSMDMKWFDLPENSVGSLCSQLQSDALAIRDGYGPRIGVLAQTITSIVASAVLSLCFSWKLGLASLALVPCVLLSIVTSTKMAFENNVDKDRETELSKHVAAEAVVNIRTVASFCLEKPIHRLYIQSYVSKIGWNPLIRGFVYGLGNNMLYFASIITYCYGGYLVHEENLPYKTVLMVGEALVFGMASIGQALAFTSNYERAGHALRRIIRLISSKQIENLEKHPTSEIVEESILDFNAVSFSYSSRNKAALQDFSTSILPGKKIALVGPSGCGKSTCIQLLQRFYEPTSGSIKLDGKSINRIPIIEFRKNFGLVSQEPVLFNRTIAGNITFGLTGSIGREEIIDAARKANILKFIESLPLGFDTIAGKRGAQLSGGEKQRIAIARALIRNPRILLLDEATSALDSESENAVQHALSEACSGRTVITISHRLNTIQNADEILVMNEGKITERGNHDTLILLEGAYYNMSELFHDK